MGASSDTEIPPLSRSFYLSRYRDYASLTRPWFACAKYPLVLLVDICVHAVFHDTMYQCVALLGITDERHHQMGSSAGAVHPLKDNADVLRSAQREQKSRVAYKGRS